MTDRAISSAGGPLRRRMTEDMTVRGFTASTQRGYLRAVRDFTAFFGRSPNQASAEDLRRYQLHMRSSGASATPSWPAPAPTPPCGSASRVRPRNWRPRSPSPPRPPNNTKGL